ncbi:DUF1769-domain-containing protein [Mytilinidion resinicola]|uniref:DUF1769-domain-containing protein n=1 Tax=Mytilinidion resinicola TaxID=574789 RepID=A0A6A6Z378_9PEZI|nr:DUF1769-domain-containing protein [Mytilinidion resinicola]KAF2814734.1 DUF1769-domain-containing protein [Mytilinidion resinicola]
MGDHSNYILKVTAGHSYDPTTHEDVHVNSSKPISISSEHIDARIHVRIKDYRGLPKTSPSNSPYFSHPSHTYDRYSIAFTFTPKRHITGQDLVFGNDFDHPIRDRLPPLFDKALGLVKYWVDPGLDGDVLGDEPYLYGPLLSSINIFRVGGKGEDGKELEEDAPKAKPKDGKGEEEVVFEEGAEEDGHEVRKESGMPNDARQRQKWALQEANRTGFKFEEGRTYACDFFNPYLDFNEFALKLGYGLPAISIVSHWDGQPLRYVCDFFCSSLLSVRVSGFIRTISPLQRPIPCLTLLTQHPLPQICA